VLDAIVGVEALAHNRSSGIDNERANAGIGRSQADAFLCELQRTAEKEIVGFGQRRQVWRSEAPRWISIMVVIVLRFRFFHCYRTR